MPNGTQDGPRAESVPSENLPSPKYSAAASRPVTDADTKLSVDDVIAIRTELRDTRDRIALAYAALTERPNLQTLMLRQLLEIVVLLLVLTTIHATLSVAIDPRLAYSPMGIGINNDGYGYPLATTLALLITVAAYTVFLWRKVVQSKLRDAHTKKLDIIRHRLDSLYDQGRTL